MVKIIVFDFDGVIVDSSWLKYDAWFQLFAERDERVTETIKNVLYRTRGQSRFEILRQILIELQEPSDAIEDLVSQYARAYNQIVQDGITELFVPETREVLAALSDKYLLYVNSATYEPALLETIAKLRIGHFFKKVFGGPAGKEEILRKIIKLERVKGKEVVVVGDGESDYGVSRACNCLFIGIANEFNGWKEGKFPLVSNIKMVENLISSLDQNLSVGLLYS